MYAQLGNIVFKGLFNFSDLNFDGDEAVFAEFALINNKPALQHVGSTLIDISAKITMNVEFCNIYNQLESLKIAKDKAEVLPLLMGNGKYVSDFVIVSMPYSIDEAFSDGTYKQISLQLSLKEYVSVNKLEQKRLSAVRSGIALGKKPTAANLRLPQPPTELREAATKISNIKQFSSKVQSNVEKLKNDPNVLTAQKVVNDAQRAKNDIQSLISQIDNNVDLLLDGPGLKDAANLVLGSFNSTITSYPFTDFVRNNEVMSELKITTRTLSAASNNILGKIIIRR